jgi:hypothetical protein
MLTMGKPLKMGGTAWRYLVENVTAEVGEVRLGVDSARNYAAEGTPGGVMARLFGVPATRSN